MACMCTNQCKKCGACCQVGCGCYSSKWSQEIATDITYGNIEITKTCPTCDGSGKIKPA